ncbi:MAG: hypothetical protein B6U89_05330 [Desulfurococcales archaeon ex4484_58]|nr:MAG: hypothetical protein B6U89_05330 [Desulfurococcales archaeon ex4484_58]
MILPIGGVSRPRREVFYGDLIIYEYYDPYLEPHPEYLVLGLPDAGLVGSIASRHLVFSKKFAFIAEIDSPVRLPPITVVHNSIPISPIQLYMSRDRRIVTLLSETPIPIHTIYPMINTIINYAREINIKYLISLSGIAVPNRLQIEKPKVYWLASNSNARELIKETEIEELKEGFVVGPYAVLLKEARRKGMSNLALFVESFLDIPDPESAAEALKVLSSIINIDIDVKELLEEAELLKLKTRELMMQTKKALSEMQKKYEMQMPLMYQ